MDPTPVNEATAPGLTACPSCFRTDLESFYRVEDIPVSSCILMDTAEEAVAFGRGPLELAVCRHCGFVFNRLFDPALVDYTMPYEESQAFSPRFRRFQDDLVARLTADHGLRSGSVVMDIGCGKGAFLEAICGHSGASGLGVDPAFETGRIDDAVDVTVVKDFFDEQTTHLTGDLIACRHTLEHIQPVGRFVDLVRTSAGSGDLSAVFFEIPDFGRILDEGAFWDIYFEHCSYFTPTSLDHLFRLHGFDVTRLEKEFDEQYLLLDAVPATVDGSVDHDAVEGVVESCRAFGSAAAHEVDHWRSTIGDAAGRVVLWGAGSKSVGFMAAIGSGVAVDGVVDINPYKQGTFLPGIGHPVLAPESLPESPPDLVVVLNPIYRDEITEMLAGMGLHPAIEAVGVPAKQ